MPKRNSDALVSGVRLPHPDKLLFPEEGLTKRNLAVYLEAAATHMLPHLADRLLGLVRCPEGVAQPCFFQRHAGPGLPREIRTLVVRGKDVDEARYFFLRNRKGLVSAGQLGAVEFHIWGSRVDDVERPDRIVFDLDPDASLPFERTRQAARRLRQALEEYGLASHALLTGGKGIHVVVPIRRRYEWPIVRSFAKALATRLAKEEPERYVVTLHKAERRGRIFIDYLRNDRGASAIAPYSPRARPGAPVAWPVAWDALDDVAAANVLTLRHARQQLAKGQAWQGYGKPIQGLKLAALRALDLARP